MSPRHDRHVDSYSLLHSIANATMTHEAAEIKRIKKR